MKSFFGRIAPAVCFVFLAVFAFSTAGLAQDLDDVVISGQIVDANNAPIVGASVTATLVSTGAARTVVTNDDGRYRIVELKPGTYTVKAESQGFGTQEKTNLLTVAAQNVQLDFKLAPAGVVAEQTVTIEADASAVDTTRTVVGGTVTEREVEELPNSTRNPLDLVFTLGGVTEEPLSARDVAEDRASPGVNQTRAPLEAGIFALSGGAAYSNNLTIDGFDNNDDRIAQERFQLPYDSVAEVQVITNQFSAEYGRASGGRVNQRTRSGSKRFRGRAYMFFRDDNLNANTYNNNRRGLARLPFTEYNPGFSLGGPIPFGYFKEKTFFFTSYEYNNLTDTALIDTLVPVQQGAFPLPSPTGTGTPRPETAPTSGLAAAQLAPFIKTVTTPSRSNKLLGKIDHNFTGAHNIAFSFQIGRLRNSRQYTVPTNALEEALQSTVRDTDAYNFVDNYVFTSKLVNQFRFQFSKYEPNFGSSNPTDPVFLIALRDTATGPERRTGTLIAGNSTAAANGNFSNVRRERRFQYFDTLSYVLGDHTLRVGGDIQNITSRYFALGDATGTYNFDSVADFLANKTIRFRRNFGTDSDTSNTYTGLFIQDDWNALSNLKVNFGLRYENESIVKDRNNFGPRFAVAYAPFKDGKGVIRFGAGLFYNRALLRTIDDFTINQINFDTRLIPGPALDNQCFLAANANQPRCLFLASLSITGEVPSLEAIRASTITGVSTAFTNAANNFDRRLDPNLNIPESYQFNLGFERDIGNGMVFEANLTHNKTVRLWREFNANTFRLPTGYTDLNDYLVRGNTSTTIRFVNGSPTDATGVVTAGGVTTVNLASSNTSTAATSPIGYARQILTAQLGRRINNSLTEVEQVASIGQTKYTGLILELRRRTRQLGFGFSSSFRAVYTLSSLHDDGIVNTSDALFPGDFQGEESRSLLDRRHRFALSGVLQTPYWLGKLRFSPILRLASGAPFNISIGGFDRSLDDVSNDRPNFSGNVKDLKFRNPGDPYNDALVQQFSLAPIGTRGGNLPRNAGSGPSQFIFDLNLTREFKFNERFKLRPSIEFDNIFNSTSFTFGSDFINFASVGTTTFRDTFLVPSRTLRPRQIRLGMRFDF